HFLRSPRTDSSPSALLFYISSTTHLRPLHSFPTRRSSDLIHPCPALPSATRCLPASSLQALPLRTLIVTAIWIGWLPTAAQTLFGSISEKAMEPRSCRPLFRFWGRPQLRLSPRTCVALEFPI